MADDLSELELAEEDPELATKKWGKYKFLVLILGSNLLVAGTIMGIILFAPSIIPGSWKPWASKSTATKEEKVAEEKGKETPKAEEKEGPEKAAPEKAAEEPAKKEAEGEVPKPSDEASKASAEESGEKGSEDATQKSGQKVQGHVYRMDPFLVNLADVDKARYLKIRVNLESNEAQKNDEYDKRLPQLRDTVLTVLTSKKQKDIFDSEGKRKLREELITQLNEVLQRFKVQTIYFTEFMIQ
jgi:flagellar protein FliL